MTNNNKKLLPTHYTQEEGGVWKVYRGQVITKKELKINHELCKDGFAKFFLPVTRRGKRSYIHSLAFANPLGAVRGAYARWDCLNGWTTTIEDVEEMDSGR